MNAICAKTTLRRAVLLTGWVSTLALQGCPLLIAGAAGGSMLIATDRRTLGAQTEDRAIQLKAIAQLTKHLSDQAHVNVAVYNRRVLLTGEVPNAATQQKTEALVRQITNVQGIVNELAVLGASSFASRSNDTYLTSKVKASLFNTEDLGSNFFKVVTERGTVYLLGLVTVPEGERAADRASRVMGVQQVVKVFQYISPEQAAKLSLGTPPQPAAQTATATTASSPTSSAATPAATSNPVPGARIRSRPLDQHEPAPVRESPAVHPGNPKAALSD